MNLDQEQLCPYCETPMQVVMPLWVTPGQDIDVGEIDWESSNPKDSQNWWCEECQSHHFPADPFEDLGSIDFDKEGNQL